MRLCFALVRLPSSTRTNVHELLRSLLQQGLQATREKCVNKESFVWLFGFHAIFDCQRSLARHITQSSCFCKLKRKRARFSVQFISLNHAAYIEFCMIMPFRKSYQMPFRKLIPPLTIRTRERGDRQTDRQTEKQTYRQTDRQSANKIFTLC